MVRARTKKEQAQQHDTFVFSRFFWRGGGARWLRRERQLSRRDRQLSRRDRHVRRRLLRCLTEASEQTSLDRGRAGDEMLVLARLLTCMTTSLYYSNQQVFSFYILHFTFPPLFYGISSSLLDAVKM